MRPAMPESAGRCGRCLPLRGPRDLPTDMRRKHALYRGLRGATAPVRQERREAGASVSSQRMPWAACSPCVLHRLPHGAASGSRGMLRRAECLRPRVPRGVVHLHDQHDAPRERVATCAVRRRRLRVGAVERAGARRVVREARDPEDGAADHRAVCRDARARVGNVLPGRDDPLALRIPVSRLHSPPRTLLGSQPRISRGPASDGIPRR